MKFSSIFIANLAEVALPFARLLKQKKRDFEINEDHMLCDRFLFADEDNRLLVTPYKLDPHFLNYGRQILKFKNVENFAPAKVGESISKAILADRKLLTALILAIKSNPKISIKSYAATSQFLELIQYLKKLKLDFKTPETAKVQDSNLVQYLDTKSCFRQIANNLGAELAMMPEGYICHNVNQILHWIFYFVKKGKDCVVKVDTGLAGAGLKIIKRQEFLRRKIKIDPAWHKETVVVEEFIAPNMKVCGGAPNIELQIFTDKILTLYVCGMRFSQEGFFRGIELGLGAVPKSVEDKIKKYAILYGKFLLNLGYLGFFEIDWVYGKDRKLYPLEANLRRTGGTHVFELAKRLFGKDFSANYYFVSNNIAAVNKLQGKNFNEVKKMLQSYLYDEQKKEGLFITMFRYLTYGKIGYIIVGKNKNRADELEKRFLSSFT